MKYLLIIVLGIISCSFSFGQDTTAVKDTGKRFEMVETTPDYPGGEEARQKFLKASLVYPTEAKKAKIEGTVMVQFIIEPDSSVSNVKVIKDLGYGCGEEAARIAGLMKWKPAELHGKPVRCKVSMPIKFKLP